METLKEVMEQQQYLTFMLAGGEFAFNILRVKEIIEYDTVTTIPKTPAWIRGVFNLRGSVVPVVNLSVKFGLGDRPVSKTTCIIVVEGHFDERTTTMGVIADSVNQVVALSPEEIQAAPTFGTGVSMDYLHGVAELGQGFVLLLDADRVLSTDELLSLDGIPALASSTECDNLDVASESAVNSHAGGDGQTQQ